MKIIGQRLRELRQNAKLSQARVAALVGTHQPVVARYESGEAQVPGETLAVLADYYDVSLDYIYGRIILKASSMRISQRSRRPILKWRSSSRCALIPVRP